MAHMPTPDVDRMARDALVDAIADAAGDFARGLTAAVVAFADSTSPKPVHVDGVTGQPVNASGHRRRWQDTDPVTAAEAVGMVFGDTPTAKPLTDPNVSYADAFDTFAGLGEPSREWLEAERARLTAVAASASAQRDTNAATIRELVRKLEATESTVRELDAKLANAENGWNNAARRVTELDADLRLANESADQRGREAEALAVELATVKRERDQLASEAERRELGGA